MDAEQGLLIKKNIETVRERIHQAAIRSGREASEISLIAVTKQKSASIIKTLSENGINKIGESYLQEAIFKIDLLQGSNIEWHMIGNIQRGKEKQIANRFQVIHSISTKNMALEMDRFAEIHQKELPIYLEMNISGESTKHGWNTQNENSLQILLGDIEEISDCSYLDLRGLMTMAPYSKNPEDSRPYFRKLRKVRDKINQEITNLGITGLSMGMSGDYEIAIEEGATVVRIGSALVGPR